MITLSDFLEAITDGHNVLVTFDETYHELWELGIPSLHYPGIYSIISIDVLNDDFYLTIRRRD